MRIVQLYRLFYDCVKQLIAWAKDRACRNAKLLINETTNEYGARYGGEFKKTVLSIPAPIGRDITFLFEDPRMIVKHLVMDEMLTTKEGTICGFNKLMKLDSGTGNYSRGYKDLNTGLWFESMEKKLNLVMEMLQVLFPFQLFYAHIVLKS